MSVELARTERAAAWATEPGALRRLAPVFLAGAFAGLAGGLGARIVMRISAMAAPASVHGSQTEAGATIGEITAEGTLFLLLFVGIGSAIVGTAFYLTVRAWLPTRRGMRAVAFGGLELVVFGAGVVDAGNPDFTIVDHPIPNVVLFCGLFLGHGMLLVLWQRPCRGLVAAVAGGVRWREVLVDVVTVGALGLTLMALLVPGMRSGELLPRIVVAVLVLCAAGLAMIRPERARPLTRPLLKGIGAVALATLALAGTLELLRSLTGII
jgi:hypothetical protein